MHHSHPPMHQAAAIGEADALPGEPSPLHAALTALLWVSFAAAAIALATWLFPATATERSEPAASAKAAFTDAHPRPDPAHRDVALLRRFALNFWVLPLLDDASPLQWADPWAGLVCDGPSQVLVDGVPLSAGRPVPTANFTMHYRMRHCRHAGDRTLEFDGVVDLRIATANGEMTATVYPQRLRVWSPNGHSVLTEAFTARLTLHQPSENDS